MAEERDFFVFVGFNFAEPLEVVDCFAWNLQKGNLTEAEALKQCRRSQFACIVWNAKKKEYVCCKNIPYLDVLNAAIESIKNFPLESKKIF